MGFLAFPKLPVQGPLTAGSAHGLRPGRRGDLSQMTLPEGAVRQEHERQALLSGLESIEAVRGQLSFQSNRLGRRGVYESITQKPLLDVSGEEIGRVGHINPGIIQRDAQHLAYARKLLQQIGPEQMIEYIKKAGAIFMRDRLPVGGVELGPEQYCELQAAITGSPVAHCWRNMQKIHLTMTALPVLLQNHMYKWQRDRRVYEFFKSEREKSTLKAHAVGAQLPSNSPGVHQLWIPFIPFAPLMLKPGSGDVLSPQRIRSACIKAGMPEEAISLYYGSGPEVGRVLHEVCGHFMIFGSAQAVKPYRDSPLADVHGPGYSKVVFGPDMAPQWREYMPMLREGIMHNGGRSCINTSVIMAPMPYAREIAEGLAAELGKIFPRALGDPAAQLAAYPGRGAAAEIWRSAQARCLAGGGEFIPTKGPVVVEHPHSSFLRPMVAFFPQATRDALKWEFLGPVVAVIASDGFDYEGAMKRTLICTALTNDTKLLASIRANRKLFVLNNEPIPTSKIDQLEPIETNAMKFLFEQPDEDFII